MPIKTLPHIVSISLGLGLLALVPLAVNIKALTFNCYCGPIDFSIYQQAIYDISILKSWNPFVSFINMNIFNDHFDPVIYLAAPFLNIFGRDFEQLLVFEWIFYGGLILSILWIFRREGRPLFSSWPYVTSLVLSKLILEAFLSPIHPTTWSALPLFWLTYFVVHGHKKGIFAMVSLLLLFKESLAFALLPLGLFYTVKRDYKLGLGITVFCLVFISFELTFREMFLGKTASHGGPILSGSLEHPLLFFKGVIVNMEWKVYLKSLYPFMALFGLWFVRVKGDKKSLFIENILPVLTYFTPLFFLFLYHNPVGYHHGIQEAAILLGLMVSLKMWDALSTKLKALGLLLFLLSSMGTYTKSLRFLVFSKLDRAGEKCRVELKKLEDSKRIRAILDEGGPHETVLATAGVIPYAMRPGKRIDHFMWNSFMGRKVATPTYDYLLLEVNNSGDTYPANPGDIQRAITNCRSYAEEILIDNEYYFFARGTFENCHSP